MRVFIFSLSESSKKNKSFFYDNINEIDIKKAKYLWSFYYFSPCSVCYLYTHIKKNIVTELKLKRGAEKSCYYGIKVSKSVNFFIFYR